MQVVKDKILTVGEFTTQAKDLLEGNFPMIWIQGEVSNLRQQSSGHVYFTLKDAGAQLPCALFRANALRLKALPKEGDQIVALGDISLYEPRGAYQLIVKTLQLSGQGRLQQQFEALKAKLFEEGLFDKEKKKEIPALPKRIGVVTSPSGAAIRDFYSILKRRKFYGSVLLYEAVVQGEQAPESIINAINLAQKNPQGLDLLIVMRGGGSMEDLFCFNDEGLVRKIHEIEIPTISAIGHEIDYTLSDFVCDMRAETPSGAAEMISSSSIELHQDLERLGNRLTDAIYDQWSALDLRLKNLTPRLEAQSPRHKLNLYSQRLDELGLRLKSPANNRLKILQSRLEGLAVRLESTSMHQTLKRGFAWVQDPYGKAIRSVKDFNAQAGLEPLTLAFHDGTVDVYPFKT